MVAVRSGTQKLGNRWTTLALAGFGTLGLIIYGLKRG